MSGFKSARCLAESLAHIHGVQFMLDVGSYGYFMWIYDCKDLASTKNHTPRSTSSEILETGCFSDFMFLLVNILIHCFVFKSCTSRSPTSEQLPWLVSCKRASRSMTSRAMESCPPLGTEKRRLGGFGSFGRWRHGRKNGHVYGI